jgi:hypothetical protein
VDYKEGPQKQSRFQLEMCCSCCTGRQLWFGGDSLLQLGNSSLRDLARQTVQLWSAGLEIRSKPPPASADFTMLSELDDEEDWLTTEERAKQRGGGGGVGLERANP